jgi:hypothetical protein
MEENFSNDIVQTAVSLYKMGLNVFPVPSPKEVIAWAEEPGYRNTRDKRDASSKPPYLLNPIFNNRLHMCDESCAKRYLNTGKRCLPESLSFNSLFLDKKTGYKANLACMLGRTSGNLMVMDCDSQDSFRNVQEIVFNKKIPHWAYSSFRGGGVLVRVEEGEVKNKDESSICDVQIFGNHHFSVLPPSVHPSGVVYSWLNENPFSNNLCQLKPVSIKQLDWLGAELLYCKKETFSFQKQTNQFDLTEYPNWVSRLSYSNQEFVVNGVKISERNNRLFSAACDIAGNNIDYEIAEDILLQACSKCSPPYPENEACETIQSAYSTKRTPSRKYHVPVDGWQKAIDFSQRFNWTTLGRTWKSDQSVFFAAIDRAKMERNSTFRCSVREIKELSSLSLETVVFALHRLSGNTSYSSKIDIPPLLEIDHSNPQNKVNYYRFTESVLNFTNSEQYFSLVDDSVRNLYIPNPETSAEKDVFKKIGKIGWKIWKYLLENSPKTLSEISNNLEIQKYSVRRVLDETAPLLSENFVIFNKDNKTFKSNLFSEVALKNIAKKFGTDGKSEKVRMHHIREREIRANQKIAKVRDRWLYRRYVREEGINEDTTNPNIK